MADSKESPLVAIFREKGIRMLGTANEPLFCATDVARYIQDSHGAQTFQGMSDEYIKWEEARDSMGRLRKTRFLVEFGLYEYLLASKRTLARPFKIYTYRMLKEERKRLIDAAELEAHIAQTKCEEYKQAALAAQQEAEAARRETVAAQAKAEAAEKDARSIRQDWAHQELDSLDLRREVATLRKCKGELARLRREKADAELEAFDRRWGPCNAVRASMGLPPRKE